LSIRRTPHILRQNWHRRSSLVLGLDVDGLLLFSCLLVSLTSGLYGDDIGKRRKQRTGGLTGVLGHESVHDDKSGHGLNNRNGTGNNAGVVAALCLESALSLVVGGGCLRLANGGSRLEANSEVDVSTVGDTALDTARVVGLCGQTRARNTGLSSTRSSS